MNPDSSLLVCEVDPTAKDLVVTLLVEAGVTAVLERDGTDGMTTLEAGFRSDEEAEAAARTLVGVVGARLEQVPADEWITTQRPAIQPVSAGRFAIRAPWHEPPPNLHPDQLAIVIDPGGAFGHGGHPSTSMVLGLLDRLITPGTTVVDIGTGTGILAIASAMLGARVHAVDIDAGALDIARRNVERNGVECLVDVARAEPDTPPTADVALVNMTISNHRTIAPLLHLVPAIVVSGILDGQYDELVELYRPRSATTLARSHDWVAAVLD